MLILQGRPITNCLRFYEYFDVEEILSQPKEFLTFAKGHLRFHPVNERCIELFEMAYSGKKLRCTAPFDFWQKNCPGEISRAQQDTLMESFVYHKATSKTDWENRFIMATAAMLLAKQAFCCPKEKEMNFSAKGEILSLTEKRITLTPGRTYTCPFDDTFCLDDKMMLFTVCLSVEAGYSGVATVWFGEHERRELRSGTCHYLNAVNGIAVCILPDEVFYEGGVLKRGTDAVFDQDDPTDIPLSATSFAVLGEGKYLYLKDGQLHTIGIREEDIPYALRKPQAKYAEVAVYGGEFYLLTQKGVVKCREGTPLAMQNYYTSLKAALKGKESHGNRIGKASDKL